MIHPSRTEADREKEVTMMTSPLKWPRWPWLPMKRTVNLPNNIGIHFADDKDEPFIIRKYDGFKPTFDVLMEYPNANAAFDDGWVVD